MDEVITERHGGPAFITPQAQRTTVNELLDDLVAEYKLGGKRGIPREVNPQMESHLKRLRDFFGEMRAVSVSKRHMEEFISAQKQQGKQNATINRSTQLLSQAFKIAAAAEPPKVPRALKIRKLDESGNVRTGKFVQTEVEAVAASLPKYMADVARFAYQCGARAGEILKLRWSYLDGDAIAVPAADTKNRTAHSIVITPELEEILAHRRDARKDGCDLIFHHDGQAIVDYRKCWQSACVINGLGKFYCRVCKDEQGNYNSVLDAERKCPNCGQKWDRPKYIGRIFHDFRRSAAHEAWKAGNTTEDCMEMTGHKSASMFKRYADLFSEDEKRARQRDVQQRRSAWRKAQTNVVVMHPRKQPTDKAQQSAGVN